MKNKKWFLIKSELDYCEYCLYEAVKLLNQTQNEACTNPINRLIDNAVGFNDFDYRKTVMVVYWCEQVILRKKKLQIEYDATQILKDGVESFLIKVGKEEYLKECLIKLHSQNEN